jgi:HD-GYP domain-containing protein (c-di-GMP phosphodiesterase class II)
MTTDRPYRRRLSHREAVRRLAESSGSQFDPHVVEVALRVLELPAEELELSAPDPPEAA